jgi:hypothetical protein
MSFIKKIIIGLSLSSALVVLMPLWDFLKKEEAS